MVATVDLVDSADRGDKIEVHGIYQNRDDYGTGVKKYDSTKQIQVNVYVEANNIRKIGHDESYLNADYLDTTSNNYPELSEAEKKRIHEEHRVP